MSDTHYETDDGVTVCIQHCEKPSCNKYLGVNYPSMYCRGCEPVVIVSVDPIHNTQSGNLRKRLTLEDGRKLETAPDAAVGYNVANYIGQKVQLDLDYKGRVDGLMPVSVKREG